MSSQPYRWKLIYKKNDSELTKNVVSLTIKKQAGFTTIVNLIGDYFGIFHIYGNSLSPLTLSIVLIKEIKEFKINRI